jgi:hypothetical protein
VTEPAEVEDEEHPDGGSCDVTELVGIEVGNTALEEFSDMAFYDSSPISISKTWGSPSR